MNGVQSPNVDNHLKAKQLFNKATEQEKELRNLSKRKSPFDRSIATLRNSIRDIYEQILFLDYDYAVSVDIEQAIWKTIFYRVIEEYRKKLRRCATADDKDSPSVKDELIRVQTSFRNFLSSASGFYQQLIQKFQQTFHLVLDGSVSYIINSEDGLHRSYLSCQRCFIFLGDIARYHKDIQEDYSNDLKQAEKCYQRALQLVPDNGNPHNQLAVLATYADDDFTAVYRYFRSLAVVQPFTTARDNLVVLFEKNKAKLEELTTSLTPEGPTSPGFVRLLLCRYVRLLGFLFTKTEMEVYDSLKDDVMRMLEACVAIRTDVLDVSTVLKMVAVAIFTVHNAKTESPAKSSYADISNRSVVQGKAITLVLDISTKMLRNSKYFGVLWITLEWLRVHPDYLKHPDNTAETAVCAWEAFWTTLAKAVNHYSKHTNSTPVVMPLFLPEEAELRGFRPLFLAFTTLPPSVLAQPPGVDIQSLMGGPTLLAYRVYKICEFAVLASRQQPRLLHFDATAGLYSVHSPNSKTQTISSPIILSSSIKIEQTQQPPQFNQLQSSQLQSSQSQSHGHVENGQEEDEEDEEDDEADNEELNQKASQYEFVSSPEDEVYIPPPKRSIEEAVNVPPIAAPVLTSNLTATSTSTHTSSADEEENDEEVILFKPPGSSGDGVDQKIDVVAPTHQHPLVGIIGEKPTTPTATSTPSVPQFLQQNNNNIQQFLQQQQQQQQQNNNNNHNQQTNPTGSVFNSSLFATYPFPGQSGDRSGATHSPNLSSRAHQQQQQTMMTSPIPSASLGPNSRTSSASSIWSSNLATTPSNSATSYSLFAGHDNMPVIDRPFQQPTNNSPLLSRNNGPTPFPTALGGVPQPGGPLEWLRNPIMGSPTLGTHNNNHNTTPHQPQQTQQNQPPQYQQTMPPNYSPFPFPFPAGMGGAPAAAAAAAFSPRLQAQQQQLQQQHQQLLQMQQQHLQHNNPPHQQTQQTQPPQQQQVPPQYRTKNPFITT